MKVLIIMPLAEQRGGGELMVLHLLQQGQDLGITWLVIFLAEGPMVEQVRALGVAAQVVDAGRLRELPRYLRAVQKIAGIARREKIDLIFGWMNQGHLYGGIAAKLAGVPAAWYQIGLPLTPGWNDRMATRIPALGILACSQAGADAQARLKPHYPMPVVYPGVELERFDPEILPTPAEAKRQLRLPAQGPLIGIAGRLQRWKGIHVLIEALPQILKTHPDAHCVVVGGEHAPEPEYPAYLRERIDLLGLANKVTLAGLQNNVPLWMQAMDVIVHASDHEPFGIVVIEAMALGKSVVAGNTAGPTEVITDGVNGLLTPYGDADALAMAVLRHLDDPEFARQAGTAARVRAQDFSTRHYAENCISALQSLVTQTNGTKLA